MSPQPGKSRAPSYSSECGMQFLFRPPCQKISHRRHIPKSGDLRGLRIAPAASTWPRRRKRRELSHSAMRFLWRPRCAARIPRLCGPHRKRASEPALLPAWPRSIPRDATIRDSNAIRDWGSRPRAEPESLSSGAVRANPVHIRCARESPRAMPATRLQTHFAEARRCRTFLFATRRRAFHGRASPDVVRENHIAGFDPQAVALKTSPQQQAAPKRKSRRLRAYGGWLPKPELPSPHRQPSSEREPEFSSRLARFPAPHRFSNGAPKTFWQIKGNPATIHGKRRELYIPQIPHIFLRAQQRIGAAIGGSLLQLRRLTRRVYMMIQKVALLNHLESPIAQVLEKCGGVPNSAKCQKTRLPPILLG